MSNYLEGMIARREHTQMNQSLQPVLDFDRRGNVENPGWFDQSIVTLFQFLSSILLSLRLRVRHEQTLTGDIPLSDNG